MQQSWVHDIEECNSPASERGAHCLPFVSVLFINRFGMLFADRLVAHLNDGVSSTSHAYAPML